MVTRILTFIQRKLRLLFFLAFSAWCMNSILAQDQYLDSLKNVFRTNGYDRAKKLELLDEIAYNETNPEELIVYSTELIESAKERNNPKLQLSGYLYLGSAYNDKAEYSIALENFLKAAKIADDNKFDENKGDVTGYLANVYAAMQDNTLAIKNYRESIVLLKKHGDSLSLANSKFNFGDFFYRNLQQLDSALHYYKESEKIFLATKNDYAMAYVLGSEGLIYAQLDDQEIAEEKLDKAVEILKTYSDYGAISEYLVGMSDIYLSRNQKQKALKYAKQSLNLAIDNGFKRQISESYFKIYKIYKSLGNYRNSLNNFEIHIAYRDSVTNVDMVRDIEKERSKFELDKKEQEKKLVEQQAKTQKIINVGIAIVLVLIGVLAFFLFRRNKFISETNKIIEKEKQRSEDLLMNILPEETAQELKEKGSVNARKYESVSVLFTDFKGFTEYSEKLSPEDLVKSIDYYFSNFDKIMEKYGIEKIKTVGDAYMCACGLPFPEKEHSYKITMAALEIVEFINQTKFINQKSLAKFDIRVGIHTGPVVAGVVGTKKFAYDIWGDTVNTASRMESSGAVGRVNISETTYELLKGYEEFSFESRGAIKAKGKGEIEMYFVSKKVF